MSTPTAQEYPISRAGKPINLGDQVTVLGTVSAVTGTGSDATLTITLVGSGGSISAEARDVGASSQTL